jgi:hypothetical protein
MKTNLKSLAFLLLAFAPAAAAHAQIVFSAGSNDAFSLIFNDQTKGDNSLTTVTASGTNVSSSLSGTDLSSYATLGSGTEAISFNDGTSALGNPSYSGGNVALSATFNFEAAAGNAFSDFTFNPTDLVVTSTGPVETLSISTNGGSTYNTFYTANTNGSNPGPIDLSAYLTPGATNDILIQETSTLAGAPYNGIINREGGGTANVAVTADVAAAPEPSTYALMALGAGALVFFARRRLTA